MGEISDLMISGEICEGCGCELDGEAPGYPRKCGSCRREPFKPRSSKADLPKWKNEAGDDISVRYHCNRCHKHFPTEEGARHHARDMHGATP